MTTLKHVSIILAALSLSLSAAAQLPGEDEIVVPDYSAYILTPKAPDTPRINGPKVYGARPKADFLYRIPTTGIRPMRFSVKGLPRGLKLDADKGIISGKARRRGSYRVQITATNALGSDSRELRIEIGDRIALTPPLGWNSWNCWGISISQERILESARALVESGLADYGWSYVNIDDGWQGLRGGQWNAIQPNKKFHDMKELGDSLHARGPGAPPMHPISDLRATMPTALTGGCSKALWTKTAASTAANWVKKRYATSANIPSPPPMPASGLPGALTI